MSGVLLATAGYDHTIRLWEAPSGVCYKTMQHPDSQVNKLEITPDKQYIAAAGNPSLRIFDINGNSPNALSSYDGHTNNITAVGFQKEGKWMFTGSEDGTIKIWDMRAPGCQREFESGSPLNTVMLHPNQAELGAYLRKSAHVSAACRLPLREELALLHIGGGGCNPM